MRRQREQPIRVLIQPHQQIHRTLLILLSQRLALLPAHQQPRVPIAQALIIEQLALSERIQRLFLLLFLEKLQSLQVQPFAHHDLVLLIHDSRDPAQRAAAHSLVITLPNHSHVRGQRDPAGIRQFQRVFEEVAGFVAFVERKQKGASGVERLARVFENVVGEFVAGFHRNDECFEIVAERDGFVMIEVMVPTRSD